MTTKEDIGTTKGFIYNAENKENDAPQDSPEGMWLVSLRDQPKEIRKEYKLYSSVSVWAYDNTLKVQVIEW